MSGQRVATGGYDKNIILWDTRTGEEERRLRGHTSGIASLSFSPSGVQLASGRPQTLTPRPQTPDPRPLTPNP